MENALAVIKTLVAQVADVDLEAGAHRTIFNAEIYEYHEAMVTKHPELYQPQTLPRILKCAGISATDYIRDWRSLQRESAIRPKNCSTVWTSSSRQPCRW